MYHGNIPKTGIPKTGIFVAQRFKPGQPARKENADNL
jgi:hypothetical protein